MNVSPAKAALFLLLLSPLTQTLAQQSDAEAKTEEEITGAVKVYLLMGQSNVLEMGKVAGDAEGSLEHAVKTEELYPYLLDKSGNWVQRRDVRNVAVMGSGGPGKTQIRKNEWLQVSGRKIGIETAIGFLLGEHHDEPVLVLKSAIGNRSLGWDLLPPGSPSYEFVDPKDGKTYVYAGYGESPLRWEKGSEPERIRWQAGLQYDGDVARVKEVLDDLERFYPGAQRYEIAGFFFWQGDKDRYNAGHSQKYEQNLVKLIHQLRTDFESPDAAFVCATLGQTNRENATGTEKDILEAQFAVSDAKLYPEFEGNVATVYTHPISEGGASNGHYGGNAKTYMNVGEAMAKAMIQLQAEVARED